MNLFQAIFQQSRKPSTVDVIQTDYAFQDNADRPTILILSEHLTATYYLSFHYVLKQLHDSKSINFYTLSSTTLRKNIEDVFQDTEDFVQKLCLAWQPSLVIFSRYGLPYGEELLQACKQRHIPTVYHIDDDLLNLPSSLGTDVQKRHGNPQVRYARQVLLSGVDLIYASTPILAERLAEQFPAQPTFYGMYAPYLDRLLTQSHPPRLDRPLTIGYMGSKGHREDLQNILPAIAGILTDYPQVRFETFGTIGLPEELSPFGDRTATHKGTADYAQFLQMLQDLDWDIGLAPLQDNEFNRCKASTKFVEYTSCNIPTIASNLNVYNQFEAGQELLLAEPDCWYAAIQELIEAPQLRTDLVKGAQSRCAERFSLDVLERQIQQLLSKLLG